MADPTPHSEDDHIDLKTGAPPITQADIDNDPLTNAPGTEQPFWVRIALLLLTMMVFIVALELMGDGIKGLGQGSFDLQSILQKATGSALLGLITGILATSLVQSSSTTTSIVVTLVATGVLSVENAIPVIMGANIGTTVTNTIVSMGHITQPVEFRRAMAGATVHDFFNWLAVLILLPLELIFGIISGPATALSDALPGVEGGLGNTPFDLLAKWIGGTLLAENAWLITGLGLALLFLALRYLVVILKSLVLGRSESALDKYVFGNPILAMGFGMVLTFLVQSSSVTTSLVVPLIGAGVLTVRQVFPYMLGSNVGTTATALLAALVAISSGEPMAAAGLTIALCHMIFNVFGIVIIYPLSFVREIPIRMAEFVGKLAFENRLYAVAYIVLLFYGLPLLLEFVL
ncbi:MAG: Na/Pi symporter [Bacteroidota bacterium]